MESFKIFLSFGKKKSIFDVISDVLMKDPDFFFPMGELGLELDDKQTRTALIYFFLLQLHNQNRNS